jgi:Mlc titration factor MtfA (ptsG expression regulator)
MAYPLALLWLFGGFFFLFLFAWLIKQLIRQRRLRAIEKMPFPEKYRRYLQRIEHYRHLGEEEKAKIERSILRFIHTKEFIGVRLQIRTEMKVVIAFYACLIVLKKEGYCYPRLKQILLYSHDFIVDEIKGFGGIYTKARFVLEGQSGDETVVLSWHDARKQAYHLRHHNVIIHEFAHELDFEGGTADGIPSLERSAYGEWVHVMHREFVKLENAVQKGRYLGKYRQLGEYAATNEAEFFAVTSELFFERPYRLHTNFPEIFSELQRFYGCDPREWIPPSSR